MLFVCTGNAGRSQIAQAMARRRFGDRMTVESAGVAPWDHLHPMAVKVMTERGLDLSVCGITTIKSLDIFWPQVGQRKSGIFSSLV